MKFRFSSKVLFIDQGIEVTVYYRGDGEGTGVEVGKVLIDDQTLLVWGDDNTFSSIVTKAFSLWLLKGVFSKSIDERVRWVLHRAREERLYNKPVLFYQVRVEDKPLTIGNDYWLYFTIRKVPLVKEMDDNLPEDK